MDTCGFSQECGSVSAYAPLHTQRPETKSAPNQKRPSDCGKESRESEKLDAPEESLLGRSAMFATAI
jgi:hypothetical protein